MLDDLNLRIRYIIDNKLTDRQKQVVNMLYFKQMTQTEIAADLGLCQPTIHKIYLGNIDYKNNQKRYGGALKKMRKICAKDDEIQDLLFKIQELRSGQA